MFNFISVIAAVVLTVVTVVLNVVAFVRKK